MDILSLTPSDVDSCTNLFGNDLTNKFFLSGIVLKRRKEGKKGVGKWRGGGGWEGRKRSNIIQISSKYW